jgi:hypothetical protein
MMTNRSVTSREYKLMLRADRFHDRRGGAQAYWSLVRFLALDKAGGQIYKEQDEELRRTTWYLDTPGTELNRHGFALRVREEQGAEKRFKVTLKFRGADRYVSACQDLSCREKVKKGDDKFEEDILPPFLSKFARSASFETDELPRIETMGQVIDLFPGLARLGIPQTTPIEIVNRFQAHEVAQRLGQLAFSLAPGVEVDKPDFVVKCCLTFWYLLGEGDEWPLTAEFSFDYDLPKADAAHSDRLEHFPPEIVVGSGVLFQSLQRQVGWLESEGSTKTAYAFGAL